MQKDELNRRFGYHPPTNQDVIQAHEHIREECADLATWLNDLLVDGREKSLAMTKLDEVCMYANASVARTQLVRLPARPDSPFA